MYWKKELKKGRHFLSEEKFQKALKCFEAAVTECPVTSKKGLEKSLFYLGVTLKHLGKHESALKCWHLGRNMQTDGLSKRMIEKHSNRYGMVKIQCEREEDKAAFIGIQLEKYLNMKKVNRFCTEAEKDVVKEIIVNYWSELLTSGEIDRLALDKKIKFFKNQKLVFPFADISYYENDSVVLYADFQKGEAVSMEDLCFCGSGLSFSKCCGRIKSPEVLGIGDF